MITRITTRTVEKASNRILTALSENSRVDLDELELVNLRSGMVLQEADQKIEHVYFLDKGLVSVMSVNSEGASVEIGVIGSDGMVGIPAILGGFSPYRAVVQIEGQAWRMNSKSITSEFRKNRSLHDILLKYANSFIVQIAQHSICNCYHSLQERLCRWLLLARDAAGSDRFLVTHDLLARLLGTRRASVTVTAGLLQKAGLIRMARGEITIVDGNGLEAIACECYDIVRDGVRHICQSAN